MDTLIVPRAQKDISQQLLAATPTRKQRGCGCEENHRRGGKALPVAEGGAGTASSASAAFISAEEKHKPFLVLPSWAAQLTWVGEMTVLLFFEWATDDTTVGNQRRLPPDSGRNHTPGMVQELKG